MEYRIGMMQPYLFPYLGYFQLIAGTDKFVLGDDLQYVKESWINRNRILVSREDKLITFPLMKSSYLSKINEKFLADDISKNIDRLLATIKNSYARAPGIASVFPLLESIMRFPEKNFAKYTENSIRTICDYLGIKTPILIASHLKIESGLDKQDRVIRTMKKLDGNVYINPIGGVALYDASYFRQHGIKLQFHRMHEIRYRQHGNDFVPNLSIIDVLMFNSQAELQKMLQLYSLVDHSDNPI